MRSRQKNGEGCRMLDLATYKDYVGLGRNRALEFAHEAGAVVHIGRRILIDRKKIDAALDALTASE